MPCLVTARPAGFWTKPRPRGRYDQLDLQISSGEPRILAWPWEALHDSAAGLLAQTCQIERRLNKVVAPQPLDERLPRVRHAPAVDVFFK